MVRALLASCALLAGSCASGETTPSAASTTGDGQGGSFVAGTGGRGQVATTSGEGAAGGAGGAGGDAASSSTTTTSGTGGRDEKPVCAVTEGALDARPTCGAAPRPWGSDAPLVEKWRVLPQLGELSEPLVANLTDDNGDGLIDLCDTPDVLVRVARHDPEETHHSFLILSGDDGTTLGHIGHEVSGIRPAIADLDGDGVPEILAALRSGHLVALHPSGAIVWEGDAEVFDPVGAFGPDPTEEQWLRARYTASSAIAVHDLEGDGAPEILVGLSVLDDRGHVRFQDPTQGAELPPALGVSVRPTAADLDGDGVLEVLFGHVTYSAWGEELWRLPITPGYAHPADFDADGVPEVLVASEEGLTLVAPDGTILWGPTRPPDEAEPPRHWCWVHPIAVSDMDDDGRPEAIVNTCDRTMILQITLDGPTVLRSQPIPITTYFGAPQTGSTVFDFRGDRVDWLEHHYEGFRIFEGLGPASTMVLDHEIGHHPATPVVADIDDDGSADVVLIEGHPGRWVVAYEDAERRRSPARRIWNQWNYWVNHVREDATIPAQVAMPWDSHGTFRVQSRVACEPVSAGP